MLVNKRNFIILLLVFLLVFLSIFLVKKSQYSYADFMTVFNFKKTEKIDIEYIEKRLGNDKFFKEKLEREESERKRLEEERLERERLERERQEELEKKFKIAYLTFDDGPSRRVTPAILDILKEYDIKATFFVLGSMVEENPDILKRIHEEGHQIGNHTYSHDYQYLYSKTENFMNDIYKTEDLIRDVIGEDFDSKIVRFPGGTFNEAYKAPMRKALKEEGYTYIDWNALNGDSEANYRSKEELLARLKETTRYQNPAVILMHDTDAKYSTAEFLRSGIDYLIKSGYIFKVLDKDYN